MCLLLQVNALVNTTDPNLGFGGIVSKALLKAAGDTLKDECASKAPVPVGGVAVTGAGNLKCKHIMHVVLPNYDGPGGQSEKVCLYFNIDSQLVTNYVGFVLCHTEVSEAV